MTRFEKCCGIYREKYLVSHSLHLPVYEDGTDRVFRNVGI